MKTRFHPLRIAVSWSALVTIAVWFALFSQHVRADKENKSDPETLNNPVRVDPSPVQTPDTILPSAPALPRLPPPPPDSHATRPTSSLPNATDTAGDPQIAPANTADRGVSRLAGQKVQTTDGQPLGTIKDFLVETASGSVVDVVVASEISAAGSQMLRLAPWDSLRRDHRGFTTRIPASEWNRLPTIKTENFDPSKLVRAADLRGKPVRARERDLGNLEDVVIDFDHGTALALVDPRSDFGSSAIKFLVPFSRLMFGARDEDPIRTNLTLADFERLQNSLRESRRDR